mmetsp:Transcript_20738/g.46928  ORF Transcript_20738/g.46928 Transcript_20738/m.46928 type:complete len:211 (-) Transcript_20738:3-635(-)
MVVSSDLTFSDVKGYARIDPNEGRKRALVWNPREHLVRGRLPAVRGRAIPSSFAITWVAISRVVVILPPVGASTVRVTTPVGTFMATVIISASSPTIAVAAIAPVHVHPSSGPEAIVAAKTSSSSAFITKSSIRFSSLILRAKIRGPLKVLENHAYGLHWLHLLPRIGSKRRDVTEIWFRVHILGVVSPRIRPDHTRHAYEGQGLLLLDP